MKDYERKLYAEKVRYLARKVKMERLMQGREIPSKKELKSEIKKRLENSWMMR